MTKNPATTAAAQAEPITDEEFEDGIEIEEGEEALIEEEPAQQAPEEEPEEEGEGDPPPAAASSEEEDDLGDYVPQFSEKDQKFIEQRIIKKQVDRRNAAEQELAQLKELIANHQPEEEQPEPVVPEIPKPHQADYDERMQEWRQAVEANAIWKRDQQTREEQKQRDEAAAADKALEEFKGTVDAYTVRAEKMGITRDRLKAAGEKVSQIGISDELSVFLLNDPQGAAVTVHLSENPTEVAKLQNMDHMSAAAYVAGVIKPAIKAKRNPGRADAPPLDTGRHTSVSTSDADEGLAGATFE